MVDLYVNLHVHNETEQYLINNTLLSHVTTMKTLVEKINAGFEAFAKDAASQVENGNKAAGARARKRSLELEKLMKEFRKSSIAAAK